MTEESSNLVGFLCSCGHRALYVRSAVMDLFARPGETIHDVRLRMRCRVCGESPPSGPYPFTSTDSSTLWQCSDKTVSARFFPCEEPPSDRER